MPLTDNHFNAADDATSYDDPGNWSLGHVPTITERAVIDGTIAAPGFTDHGNTSQPGGIQFINGNSLNPDLSAAHCAGNIALNAAMTDVHIFDAATFTGTTGGDLVIVNLTGVAASSNAASGILVVSFSTGTINIDTNPNVSFSIIGGTVNVSAGLGTVSCAADFSSSIVLNIGAGSTLTHFIIDAGNSYATQQSGTKSVGTTVSGTYSQTVIPSAGTIRDDNDRDLSTFAGANMVLGSGGYSFKVAQDAIDGGFDYATMHIHDEDNQIDVSIGGFSTVPASTGSDNSLLLRKVGK